MSQPRRVQRKTVNAPPETVRVLGGQEYEKIRKRPRTVEIHLASALFPQRKITPSSLTKFVESQVPASGQYNAVFHFGSARKVELTAQLKKARQKMVSDNGKWFVLLHNNGRDLATKRAKKLVPKGSIKASEANEILAALSKKKG